MKEYFISGTFSYCRSVVVGIIFSRIIPLGALPRPFEET